jgi:hypothetical protein
MMQIVFRINKALFYILYGIFLVVSVALKICKKIQKILHLSSLNIAVRYSVDNTICESSLPASRAVKCSSSAWPHVSRNMYQSQVTTHATGSCSKFSRKRLTSPILNMSS